MDDTDSQGLLKYVLGFFGRKRPERSERPVSLRSRTREAWLRTDSFLQHDGFDEVDPERITRALRAFEDYVQNDSSLESDPVSALNTLQRPVLSL